MSLFDRITGKSPAPKLGSETPPKPDATAKKGFFGRLNQLLFTDVRDLFKQEGRLVDDEFLGELFAIFIRTDMGAGPAATIRDQVKTDFRGRVVHKSEVLETIKVKLRELMAQPEAPIKFATSGPTVVMVVGVNGSGKTTSIAKLATMFKQQGKQVVLGAGDTFRAAAVQQLTILSLIHISEPTRPY